MFHHGWIRVGVLACALVPATAIAQQPAITLDRYRTAGTPEDDFHVERAADFGHLRFGAQLAFDYAFAPLVYEATRGDSSTEVFPVVEHHLVGALGLSLGLFERLVIYGDLPVTLRSEGTRELDGTRIASVDDAGLGNASVGARVRLAGERSDFYAIALAMSVAFPTAGDDQHYRGERSVSFAPRLIGELRPGLGARVVLDVGARVHDEASMPTSNIALRHELTWALGFAIPLFTDADPRTHLDAHAQVFGATSFADPFGRDGTGLEGLAGVKLHHASGIVAGLAGGAGLARGIGTPDARVVATVGYALPEVLPASAPSDGDHDGIADDRCPGEPEDRDQFQDDDGCPDADDDGDGIDDARDRCASQAETVNGFEDEDGCPDAVPDSDGDGVRDDADRCASEAEDRDGRDDEDGCPDLDDDGDAIADAEDLCPTEAGIAENRGCPDRDADGDGVVDRRDNCPSEAGSSENQGCLERQAVALVGDRLEIRDVVQFGPNNARIGRRSHALLLNVARVINAHPEIARVLVEGHSDARGSRERNVALSTLRAEAVVDFLVERGGVDRSRLSAQGFGPDRPIVENATRAADHARNRRVELRIVER